MQFPNQFLYFKHCKPAVDEETFQKMVERQYEAMKRERMRQLDEPNQIKPSIRPDDDISAVPQPPNTANSATEAQPSEQEVSKC